ncbi:MAG: hypothetical protein AB7F65_05685 [Dehalococcoidia bacterium]
MTALVVAALPGTTIASSDPTLRVLTAGQEHHPILVPVSLRSLVAVERAAVAGVDSLEALAAERPYRATVAPSVLEHATVVSVYGHPGVCVMGELGCHGGPEGAIEAARSLAAEYDALNGDRPAIAALHLIVDVAQARPGADGQYLDQMPLDQIAEWVEAAREADVLIFLDIQIGWGDLSEHVRRLEPFLEEPFVHLAIDPEFATQSRGARPGLVIGTLTADEVNEVQAYLAGIVGRTGQDAKVLVLHQFRPDMLTSPELFADVAEVEITIDMDGWGGPWPKLSGYEAYALAPYAERPALKLFYHWDEPLLTAAEVMGQALPPAYVIYQ